MVRAARMTPDEFDGVLRAAQAGGSWALERIYRTYSGSVVGYLSLQGVREPEDTASEVFISAFRTIGRFSGDEAQFRSWLFTIAHRRLIDARRAASRQHEVPVEEFAGLDQPADQDVVGAVEQRLATERVRELCAALVPDQRSVLLLRLIGGLTIDEIAEAVGKSPGAVKALQRRGLAALRRRVEREGVPL